MERYAKRHPDLRFSSFTIPQVAGSMPRSGPVRGVLESLVKSKRYVFPLASLAVIQPYVGGGLAYAWVTSGHFNPRSSADAESPETPEVLARELEENCIVDPPAFADPAGPHD